MIPTVEWPTKAKEAPPQEVRLTSIQYFNVLDYMHVTLLMLQNFVIYHNSKLKLHIRIQRFMSGIKALI